MNILKILFPSKSREERIQEVIVRINYQLGCLQYEQQSLERELKVLQRKLQQIRNSK